ncbi:hypothetical protein C3486_17905 [Streptomyces sp. Ru73]|uniref:hypothetical protein n=1 Tax=Streptomyces sp. Ru73 TaxID=2080748 RepID=UPI000CDE154B|nr:hypothetical protein [Streptomyces sp. Ru73]POX39551.1 hypothetical protein C3486_17905 [Streptomyces sp. Ru73]
MKHEEAERSYDDAPWWAGFGPVGAVGLIVLGAVVAVWVFFRLPGTPENLAGGYYGAAKIIAIGLVVAGGALWGRSRR